MPPPPAGKGINQSIGGYQCIRLTAHALAGLWCPRVLPVQPATVRSCCSHSGTCTHASVGCRTKDCARQLFRGPKKTGLQPDPSYPSAGGVSVRQLAAHRHPAPCPAQLAAPPALLPRPQSEIAVGPAAPRPRNEVFQCPQPARPHRAGMGWSVPGMSLIITIALFDCARGT